MNRPAILAVTETATSNVVHYMLWHDTRTLCNNVFPVKGPDGEYPQPEPHFPMCNLCWDQLDAVFHRMV